MLQSLHIKNYALIRDLKLEFDRGLTIITGETGAGKSILLGALGLVMGERADTKVLYNTEAKCVVQATFDVSAYDLRDFFAEHDLDYDDELLIQRELTPSGKSRAFVNDTPVRLNLLQKLSSTLIDLHRQFDTLDINDVSFQLRLLDALAGQQESVRQYRRDYHHFLKLTEELKQLKDEYKKDSAQRDYMEYYLHEIVEANIKAGEEEELEQQQKQLTHAGELSQKLHLAHFQLLDSDEALLDRINSIIGELAKLQDYMPALKAYVARMEELLVEMQELSAELPRLSEEAQASPEKLEQIHSRLDQLYLLQKKHRANSCKELLEKKSMFEEKLREENLLKEKIQTLEKELATHEKKLQLAAEKISKGRQKAAPAFRKKVVQMLHQLAMPSARLEIHFAKAEKLQATGIDKVDFLFSANKGMPLQPIKNVASGGELARLTLTTKSLVASAIPLPTLIFDEIDTGISGDVALKMGNILAQLARHHQVVCITHSPQVAAHANKHYEVFKRETKDSTQTDVVLLKGEERIRAIAVMLSQNPPSEAALANARELIQA